jgi:hypothetical protein
MTSARDVPSGSPPDGISSTTSLNEIVARAPETLRVFARHGMDTCCGGTLPLDEAARRHGVALKSLMDELVSSVGVIFPAPKRGPEPRGGRGAEERALPEGTGSGEG